MLIISKWEGNLRNKPSKRGFTLIELLAVIVILAIIALIAIPQVIKILNKARMSSAEDSVYGIVKSAENYITEFMLKNNGELPNEKLTFSCGNGGCSLDNNLEGYNLTDLDKLNYKGTKASSGKVTIENENIEVSNIIINGFTCNYPIEEKAKCYTSDDLKDLLEINNISLTSSLNSIKVVLNISGNASKYEYSIDGKNYIESNDNTYTFDNLEASHEYTIYVRVSNDSKTKEASKVVKTLELSAPEITVEKEDTWTQSKTVTIKYPSGENLVYSYKIKSLDGNTILVDDTPVTEETTNIEVTENSIIIATVMLGSNFQSITEEVTNIDRTAPISSTFTETHTTNSITLTATGIDSESGIYGYQFSIDNGITWLPSEPQKNNTYTFNDLEAGISYNLIVKVINNTYLEDGINENNTLNSESVYYKISNFKVRDVGLGIALGVNGDIYTWGSNLNGELGNGTTSSTFAKPSSVNTNINVSKITGDYHRIILDKNGDLWVWGDNSKGQLGNGTNDDVLVPTKLDLSVKFKDVSAGNNFTIAIDTDGYLWTWGYNEGGQLGNGNRSNKLYPQKILPELKFKKIFATSQKSFVLTEDGVLYSFGIIPTSNGASVVNHTPYVITNKINFKKIVSYNHVLAIDTDGNLYAWGTNSHGELGDGTTNFSSSPIQIMSDKKFVDVAVTYDSSMALDSDGNLWVWGRNSHGQLGTGSTEQISIPTKLSINIKIKSIYGEGYNTYIIDEGNYLWGCGANGNGFLGNDTNKPSYEFIKITD